MRADSAPSQPTTATPSNDVNGAADPRLAPIPTLCNIAARMDAWASAIPETPAVIHHGQTLSYAGLRRLTDLHARRLADLGITRGTRVALMVKPGHDFFALTFALFKLGAVPVLVDPGMGLGNLGKCLREAAPTAFIGIPLAHVARTLGRWAGATLQTRIVVGGFFPGATRLDTRLASDAPLEPVDTDANDMAAILFTSGSTGVPKGAIYRHATFDAQVRFLTDHFGFGPGSVDLPTFPLFALFDAAIGVTAVIPEMDFTRPGSVDPEKLAAPIRRYGVTQMFGSPALIDRVGRWGEDTGAKFNTVRHVISAGAPVPPAVMKRFAAMLPPDALIHTPYGATEALPVAAITHPEVLGETAAIWATGGGTCVGKPISGVEVALIRITDDPIATFTNDLHVAPGEPGEIAVRGPIISQGYVSRPDHDAKSKMADGDSVWHRMGDIGRLDEQGRLWFLGRKAHRVQTTQGDMFTITCEAIFNQHPLVRRTALVGIGEPGKQRPILCVELEPGSHHRTGGPLTDEILALGAASPHTAGIHDLLFHPSFPVDIRHNAKIFREKLAVWAAKKLP